MISPFTIVAGMESFCLSVVKVGKFRAGRLVLPFLDLPKLGGNLLKALSFVNFSFTVIYHGILLILFSLPITCKAQHPVSNTEN